MEGEEPGGEEPGIIPAGCGPAARGKMPHFVVFSRHVHARPPERPGTCIPASPCVTDVRICIFSVVRPCFNTLGSPLTIVPCRRGALFWFAALEAQEARDADGGDPDGSAALAPLEWEAADAATEGAPGLAAAQPAAWTPRSAPALGSREDMGWPEFSGLSALGSAWRSLPADSSPEEQRTTQLGSAHFLARRPSLPGARCRRRMSPLPVAQALRAPSCGPSPLRLIPRLLAELPQAGAALPPRRQWHLPRHMRKEASVLADGQIDLDGQTTGPPLAAAPQLPEALLSGEQDGVPETSSPRQAEPPLPSDAAPAQEEPSQPVDTDAPSKSKRKVLVAAPAMSRDDLVKKPLLPISAMQPTQQRVRIRANLPA